MLDPLELLAQLKGRLDAGLDTLPLDRGEGLASLVLALPRVPTCAPQLDGQQFQFLHIHQESIRAGYGSAAEWQADGPDRLRRLAAAGRRLRDHWHRADPDATGFDAFAMLGFAASGDPVPMVEDHLPNALLWVPEIGLRTGDGHGVLVLSAALPVRRDALRVRWERALEQLVPALYRPVRGPLMAATLTRSFAEPDRGGWADLVHEALAEIDGGGLEKVVLSRRLDVTGTRTFDVGRLLGALGCLFPSCQVVNLRRNGASFVSATPERLLHQHGSALEVDAIAGTAGRAEDAERDAALARALTCCDKNLREHRVVIDAIREALRPCCEEVAVPPAPDLMQLSNAQHLWSPIRARVAPDLDVLDLAERLHPTPATNGHPRRAARDWLRNGEPFMRGWYTGAAGIVEPDLSGELWVLLRCARVCGNRAELYAGAGIVAGSDAELEWDETEAKLGAMLTALQYA
jgi:menaquinone-specific isochorismate synthase